MSKQDKPKTIPLNEQLEKAIEAAGLNFVGYDPSRPRSISLTSGKCTADRFRKDLLERLGAKVLNFPSLLPILHNPIDMEKLIHQYASEKFELGNAGNLLGNAGKDLFLHVNVQESLPAAFFVADSTGRLSNMNGSLFVRAKRLSEVDALTTAIKVYPVYNPHMNSGVLEQLKSPEGFPAFNTYRPAPWRELSYKTMAKGLPPLFERLVNHLFPLQVERDFFYSWLAASLYGRAMTYLVLCGAPGVGKNRLKLVMRALHGASNTVDGKRSTLTERFNSQLTECTLLWFDELSYDGNMENTLKEIQNDTLAIERKGLDATRATRIFASSVISNNKPRDNHIAMDARKFVPLRLTKHRLEKSMTPAEIDLLSRKVADESSPDYDPTFIAQIAKWLKVYADQKRWPNQEYRGPMFYYLAHTSMSRWQKEAVIKILDLKKRGAPNMVQDKEKGFLWSPIHKSLSRQLQAGNKTPDYSTVSHFLSTFVDATGKKIFKITKVPGDILGDFYVKQLKINIEINIDVESTTNGKTKKESDYL